MKKNTLIILGVVAAIGVAIWALLKRNSNSGYYTPSGGAASVNPFGNLVGSIRSIVSPSSNQNGTSSQTWSTISTVANQVPSLIKNVKDLFGSYSSAAPTNSISDSVRSSIAAGTVSNPNYPVYSSNDWDNDYFNSDML